VTRLHAFLGDRRAVTAAEFALVLPALLLFLFGIVDAGRFGWDANRAEKATQAGARWAVATDIIPGGDEDDGLKNYSFTTGSGVSQGTVVDNALFPGVYCETAGGALACTCKGTCAFDTSIDSTAQASFDAIVGRMQAQYPAITADNVRIDYDWSGLGFSGDPNGADVAPVVTVKLRNMVFQPLTLFLFKTSLPLPSFSYSLTMEDGDGTYSN
jgi:hypothetical protein